MKKIIFMTFLALLPLFASQKILKEQYKENPFLKNDDFPGGYSLSPYSMPRLIGIYMMKDGQKVLNTTSEQHKYFEKRFKTMFNSFFKTAKQIRKLETQMMKKVVYEGADEIDVKNLLELIKEKRTKLTIMQINCANSFKKNLSKEKYTQILKMTEKAIKDKETNEQKK